MAPRGNGGPASKAAKSDNHAEPVPETSEGMMERYSALIDQLSTFPYDRALHEQHVQVTGKLGDASGQDAALQMLAEHFALHEHEWHSWINLKKQQLDHPAEDDDGVTKQVELLELYQRAIDSMLSIDLLQSYTDWMTSNYFSAHGLAVPALDEDGEAMQVDSVTLEADPIKSTIFSLDQVRQASRDTLDSGGHHLTQSHRIWNLWRDFELGLLKLKPSPEQLEFVDKLFLDRLTVPHTEMDSTFAAYSSFVTKHRNDDYDTLLPKANKIYGQAKQKMNEREEEEAKLKAQDYSESAYIDYVSWEREVKKPDVVLTRALLERAVKDHPSSLALWEEYIDFAVGLALWSSYVRAAEKTATEVDVDQLYQRAIDTKLFDKDVDELVMLVEARAGHHRRQIDEALPVGAEAENPDLAEIVVLVLTEGIELTKKAKKGGDPQLRLEKYLVRIFERFGRLEEAAEVWNSIVERRPNNYASWYGQADFETRRNNPQRAHEIYSKGCSQRGLDYPEYLLEAWLTFEKQNGNLADLEYSMKRISRQRKGLERKRYREAMEAAQRVQQQQAASAQADAFITGAVQGQASGNLTATNPEQDSGDKKRERSPAAADGEGQQDQANKRPRIDSSTAAETHAQVASTSQIHAAPTGNQDDVKRDRENATVFVIAPEASNMTESDLYSLFKDCGEIREVKVKSIGDRICAMVEFTDRETVLPARTKDKKRVNGQEIDVHVAVKACLYVTNFPESYDKAAIEQLFSQASLNDAQNPAGADHFVSQFGVVFDTRWPSKRFKSTRRFCYIQYTSPARHLDDAQAALALHNTEVEGHKLSVMVSDPSRKKDRTDLNANDKELYVANLARSTKEDDLRALFSQHGALKGVRVPVDEKGMCKGFAFVEYESETSAQAALVLNNHELKKRHISVTIAQSRARGTHPNAFDKPTKEPKSSLIERQVRITGLPSNIEEAIIQQSIEKLLPVKQVLFEVGSSEAVVEFDSAADAGKLLILASTNPIEIDGTVVQVAAQGRQPRVSADGRIIKTHSATGSTSTTNGAEPRLMPRQAQRGRGKLGLGMRGRGGLGRGGLGGSSVSRSSAAASTTLQTAESSEKPQAGKSQDDFRALLNKK
ncbi:Splicing factor [Microbotryomycetes sp. JL201]|nr:Splicing factor [Microbotryomycetes sp. JL201]